MSVILSWENPPETFNPLLHRAEVWRDAPAARTNNIVSTDQVELSSQIQEIINNYYYDRGLIPMESTALEYRNRLTLIEEILSIHEREMAKNVNVPIVRGSGPNGPAYKICSDAPWGSFEDIEGVDPAVNYYVMYVGFDGNVGLTLYPRDIKTITRAFDLCKVMIQLRDPNGWPGAARCIEVSNEPTGYNFYQRVLTNHNGYAEIFAPYNERLQFRIEGSYTLLDCVIPAKREAVWEELRESGTILPTDMRGLIG